MSEIKQIKKEDEQIEIRLTVSSDMTLANVTLIANYSMTAKDVEDALKHFINSEPAKEPNENLN